MYEISSFKVQADDNDAYLISYLNEGTKEWLTIPECGAWGMCTRPEILLTEAITTSELKIVATRGDGWYALSEVQAFGEKTAVPEPGILTCFSLGLLSLAAAAKRRKQK